MRTRLAQRTTLRLAAVVGLVLAHADARADAHHFYTITVVDKTTQAPIPGLTMTTAHQIVYTTDASGRVRFFEPGLMDTAVFFAMGDCGGGTCAGGPTPGAACTTRADCNLGYVPPGGAIFVGAAFTPHEKGRVTLRLCPASAAGCTYDVIPLTDASAPAPRPSEMLELMIVDQATGRGVPMIHVQTATQAYVTDSAGRVAFRDAAHMGDMVQFDLSGYGYAPASVTLRARSGGSEVVQIARVNLAERLYRVTGGGIYRDTVLLEQTPPIAAPVLDTHVLGSDSVLSALYQGEVFWIWGDTTRPHGAWQFRAPGATSLLPGQGGLDPSVGVNLDYFTSPSDPGFVAAMCPAEGIPAPSGYENTSLRCWMSNLIAVPDAGNVERLLASFSLGVGFTEVKAGWAQFDDTLGYFEELAPAGGAAVLGLGYPTKVRHDGTTWAYGPVFASAVDITSIDPLEFVTHHHDNPVRTLATVSGLTTPSTYQAFTPFAQGSDTTLDVNPDGTLAYSWKTNTVPLRAQSAADDTVAADQKLYGHHADPDTGSVPSLAGGSVDWNAYRQRFVAFAAALLSGEIYYVEADTPMGPWTASRRVATHANLPTRYTTYGTRRHPFFDKQGGREVFFETTYTAWVSNSVPTPRYDYNQVMHRLDLDAVVLPVPVYDLAGGGTPGAFVTKRGIRPTTTTPAATFLAPDRAGYPNTVPVYWSDPACTPGRQLVAGGTPTTAPLFWALPTSTPTPPATTTPLYEYTSGATKAYSVATSLAGYTRGATVALVWTNPMRVALPVQDYLPALVADAGADVCVTEPQPGLGRVIPLTAAASSHAAGTIASYQWTWAGGSATGATANAYLAAGLHEITLQTTGSDGATSTDTMLVRIGGCAAGCCDPNCC